MIVTTLIPNGFKGEKSDLFTGVLFNNYGPPPGFCFDVLCADEPIIDDKWSPDNNVDKKVSLHNNETEVIFTIINSIKLSMAISRSTNFSIM